MNKSELESGFLEVSKHISTETTIVIAGSSACVLRQEISRDANDCDVIGVNPKNVENTIKTIGDKVADALGFNKNWLNAECMAWKNDLPKGWDARTTEYKTYGKLKIKLMSRLDCASMMLFKLIMSIEPDNILNDIKQMKLINEEIKLLDNQVSIWEKQSSKNFDYSRLRALLATLRN